MTLLYFVGIYLAFVVLEALVGWFTGFWAARGIRKNRKEK